MGLRCEQGWIVDLSLTGARLMSDEPLEGPIRLRFDDDSEDVEIRAKIVWLRELGPKLHETAIAFTVLTPEARKLLARIIAGQRGGAARDDDAAAA